MNKLQIGEGVEFKVLDKDLNLITFKLAIIARKSWSGREENQFGYVSENGFYTRSTYSGGNTGFGINNYDFGSSLPDDCRIVTTDLEEIKKIASQEEDAEKQANEDAKRKQEEKTERINQLPEEVEVNDPELAKHFIFQRSLAAYNPTYSRSIQGGQYQLHRKDLRKSTVWIDEYKTKSGSLQVKQFSGHFDFVNNPKESLKILLEQFNELKAKVRNA